ncbi:MAG: pseudouridine synthase [Alphaproteobacteria bacterium]
MPAETKERIAKVMARSGLCSRREAEVYIQQGRVSVNGTVLTTPAFTVTENDKILVDGEPLPKKDRVRVWKYHKPKGVMCTQKDPENRTTVFDEIVTRYPSLPRLISVGRLDYNSEGLLLLTNSGALARYLELPATGWVRRYKVRVLGTPSEKVLSNLKKGITVEGVRYGSIEASLEKNQGTGSNSWVKISLTEGKNQEIRRVMKHLGHVVNRLIRLSYGPFQLGALQEHDLEEISEKVLKEQFGKKWSEV